MSISDDFSRIFQGIMEGVATVTVGVVTAYDSDTRRGDAQPLIMRQYRGQSQPQMMAQVRDIPIYQSGTKRASVRFPVEPGDNVILISCDRAFRNWLAGDGDARPARKVRTHSINDTFGFLVRFDQNTDADDDGDPDDLVMRHNDGVLRIKPSGQIQIGHDKGNKAAARKGDTVVADDKTDQEYFTWLTGFVTILTSWTVAGGDGGLALKTAMAAYIGANPTPSTVTGKITTGSTKVDIGD